MQRDRTGSLADLWRGSHDDGAGSTGGARIDEGAKRSNEGGVYLAGYLAGERAEQCKHAKNYFGEVPNRIKRKEDI